MELKMFKKYAIYLSFLFVISFAGKSFSHYVQIIPDNDSKKNLENIIQELIKKVPLLDENMFHENNQFHMTLNADFVFNKINLNNFDLDNVYSNIKNISIYTKELISSIIFKVIDVVPLGNNNNQFIALQLRPVLSSFTKAKKKEIKEQLLQLLKETPHISIVKCSPEFDIGDVQFLVNILLKHFSGYRVVIKFEKLKIFAEKNKHILEFTF
jgi:hypothetical protein